MRQRTRKLIGTVTLMLFVPFYALVAMSVASVRLANASVFEQTIFFLVAGLIWLIPAGAIIWWMERPEAPPR